MPRDRYKDACATLNTEAMSEVARMLAQGIVKRDHVDGVTASIVSAVFSTPPWALREIADFIDGKSSKTPSTV